MWRTMLWLWRIVALVPASIVGGVGVAYLAWGTEWQAVATIWAALVCVTALLYCVPARSWTKTPATERQLAYARNLGLDLPSGTTKAQASDAIDKALQGRLQERD